MKPRTETGEDLCNVSQIGQTRYRGSMQHLLGALCGVGTAVVGSWSVSRLGLVCGAAHQGLCASDGCCHCLAAGAGPGIAQRSWGSKTPFSFESQQEKRYH